MITMQNKIYMLTSYQCFTEVRNMFYEYRQVKYIKNEDLNNKYPSRLAFCGSSCSVTDGYVKFSAFNDEKTTATVIST